MSQSWKKVIFLLMIICIFLKLGSGAVTPNYLLMMQKEFRKPFKETNNISFSARETFNSKLKKEILEHKTHNEGSIVRAKNEANAMITKLNEQLVLKREKMVADQQENSNNLEAEYKMKEDRLNNSLQQIRKRDQAWQVERADVLKEVQKFKAEATKMVKILAMEYEEENLGDDKKRSLSQEVYSLQLVVEIRTVQVMNLREQLDRVNKGLEHADVVKEKLKHETEKMEALEQQIKIKDIFERFYRSAY